jgi:hypothetical protein
LPARPRHNAVIRLRASIDFDARRRAAPPNAPERTAERRIGPIAGILGDVGASKAGLLSPIILIFKHFLLWKSSSGKFRAAQWRQEGARKQRSSPPGLDDFQKLQHT